MKSNVALIIALLWSASASAINIETVPVGDVGNPNDPTGGNLYGRVNYAFNIGKYEVTVGQYTAFLNAVAATDTHSLYNTDTAHLHIAGIQRSGVSGSYSYTVSGPPNHPITYVSWGDAARFANWMHNGQPTGPQVASTTEDGAYTLNGTTNVAVSVTRNPGARWFIPTENEWYKAAYYQPAAKGGDSDSYWIYPMKTNNVPYSDQPPGSAPDNTRVGNFYQYDGVLNGYDDGHAVTGSFGFTSTQNYFTDVGAYTLSPSYYGTFDQGGNVQEWNEAVITGSRGKRGGGWGDGDSHELRSFHRISESPSNEWPSLGFRVASVPEPTTLLLAGAGFGMLSMVRRKPAIE